MKFPRRRLLRLAAGAAAASALPRVAGAQAFPSRPISIVVPYPAGGPTDLVARILAEPLRDAFGQAVIVENVQAVRATSVWVASPARRPMAIRWSSATMDRLCSTPLCTRCPSPH